MCHCLFSFGIGLLRMQSENKTKTYNEEQQRIAGAARNEGSDLIFFYHKSMTFFFRSCIVLVYMLLFICVFVVRHAFAVHYYTNERQYGNENINKQ